MYEGPKALVTGSCVDRTKVIAVLGGIVVAMLVIAVSFALRSYGILSDEENRAPGEEAGEETGSDESGEADLVEVQWKGKQPVQHIKPDEKPPSASEEEVEKKPKKEGETD